MTGEVYHDPVAVRATVAELNEINGSVRGGLKSVSAEIDELLASGWAGAAADFFRGHYDDLVRHAEHIIDDADVIAELVSKASRATGSTDQRSATTISHLNL